MCVFVYAPLVPRLFWLGCAVWACVLGSGFGCAPPLLFGLLGCVCGRACAPLAPALPGGPPVARGCAGVTVGLVPPSPFVFFGGGGFVVSVAGCPGLGSRGLCPPIPSLPGCVVCFFFVPVWCVSAFFGVPSPGGPLPPAWGARFCWVVPRRPLGRSCLRCRLGGGFGRLLWCWWAVSCLWAVLAPPPLFFLGGVCLFLPPPSLGWRTRGSAFSVVFRVAVGGCILPGCAPAPWGGRVMYTSGPAPLSAGLDSGSAGWAVGPGGFVWPWVSRVLSPPILSFWQQLVACVGGPPPLLSGVRSLLASVWRAGAALSGVRGGLVWLDPRLASLALVLWCAVMRRAASCRVSPCCVVLVRAVLPCALLGRAVLRRASLWCAPLCRVASRRAVACCALGCLVVVGCAVVRCGAVCRAASCCAVVGRWRLV